MFFSRSGNLAGAPVETQTKSMVLETLVDFPDDALSCEFAITPAHLDSMMATLAQAGVQRVIWSDYGDGHGGFFMPAGIRGGSGDSDGLSFDMHQWRAYAATLAVLGNPLRAATQAAHRHGLELYANYKPYETGICSFVAEGSPQARQWVRLPLRGGYLTWIDPFVLRHPQLRIRRRNDDLLTNVEKLTIGSIHLTKQDASPTRVSKEHLQIWTSDFNYRYQRQMVDFRFEETVEASPSEVRDHRGWLVTARGAPVRVLKLTGLRLDAPYVLVTTDVTDDASDFTNTGTRLMKVFDLQRREMPAVFASGTAVQFPEWEDFRRGGLAFDTGRGHQPVTLDLPNQPGDQNGTSRAQGFIAMARGRNEYLPGALCETEPEVQEFWMSRIQEMLAAGVDGIDIRVSNHSTHTDTPEDYGFNPAVLAGLPGGTTPSLAAIARIRGDAYTEFLRRAKAATAKAGKRLRIKLHCAWFRPPDERAPRQRLAYPANVEFQWRKWVDQGLLDDGAVLRTFGVSFEGIFDGDEVTQEMITICRQREIPLTVNRYVYGNPGLPGEFQRVRADGRFSGFVLYETWAFLSFTSAGNCYFADGSRPEPTVLGVDLTRQTRAVTSQAVREVCRLSQQGKETFDISAGENE